MDVDRNVTDVRTGPNATTLLVSFQWKYCILLNPSIEFVFSTVKGQCRCLPGWKGDDCSVPCPANTWGIACAQRCTCLHNGTCRPNDGQCRCHDGWMGPQCNESQSIIKLRFIDIFQIFQFDFNRNSLSGGLFRPALHESLPGIYSHSFHFFYCLVRRIRRNINNLLFDFP